MSGASTKWDFFQWGFLMCVGLQGLVAGVWQLTHRTPPPPESESAPFPTTSTAPAPSPAPPPRPPPPCIWETCAERPDRLWCKDFRNISVGSDGTCTEWKIIYDRHCDCVEWKGAE